MLISYVVFNVLNVIIQTVKSIVTIKCNKWVASIVNAIAYGLYTYIVVCSVGTYYTGYTYDLRQRIRTHIEKKRA